MENSFNGYTVSIWDDEKVWKIYKVLRKKFEWPVVLPPRANHFLTFDPFCTGEGNGTPLQYSCLENPMDRGAS